MTKHISILAVILVVGLLPVLYAQEAPSDSLSSLQKEIDFGTYLLETSQYQLASWEFERLRFKYPENSGIQLKLIEAYRLSGDYSAGLAKANEFKSGASTTTDFAIAYRKEGIRNLIHLGDFKTTHTEALRLRTLFPTMNNYGANISLGANILLDNWSFMPQGVQARDLDPFLSQFVVQLNDMELKSPFKAGLYSALLPGAGKVYAGSWKDGLISFLFVGANTYSAYRGFRQSGINSVYGWVFTSLATGFYIGNIYGAATLAKKMNQQQKALIQNQAYERLLLIY
jgi:hypothetical protein